MWKDFDEWVQEQGAPPLEALEFIHKSPDLNLYLYPPRPTTPAPSRSTPTWHRLDSCVRGGEPASFELPEQLRGGEGADLPVAGLAGLGRRGLMERLVEVLAAMPHRFIVSKGPQARPVRAGATTCGARSSCPSRRSCRWCDLVITHGGNNTTTECFHHGKPMIAMPVFWDQYDNAQRVDETGFGVRLDTYAWEPSVLTSAIDSVLDNTDIHDRLQKISVRVKADPGRVRAADLIESAARA